MLKKLSISLILSTFLILVGCSSDAITDVVQDTTEDMVRDTVIEKKDEITKTIDDKATELAEGIPVLEEEVSLGDNVVTNGSRFSAKVTKVTDGDSLHIRWKVPENLSSKFGSSEVGSVREDTIRILNIDTPEVHGPKAVQEYGPEASNFAKEVLNNKVVEIELSAKKNPYDNYDRLLAYVFVDGKLYEEMIVQEGLARIAYVYEPDKKYMDELIKAENQAKESKIGIWSIPGYVDQGYDMNKAS
ncbi:thermonuclease family protein [Virgibacillus halodenitrificans]|uniref:thermonuclease family protein n=1 Tax=Virgibacillus halodenitrificans TaxID=1482 RepID=UPI001F0892F0|nr:thermonuclease family protein [Virgibacillus halodenitrificans]